MAFIAGRDRIGTTTERTATEQTISPRRYVHLQVSPDDLVQGILVQLLLSHTLALEEQATRNMHALACPNSCSTCSAVEKTHKGALDALVRDRKYVLEVRMIPWVVPQNHFREQGFPYALHAHPAHSASSVS